MKLDREIALATRYYENRLGYWPEEAIWKITVKTIWFLKVNQFTEKEIYQILLSSDKIHVSVDDLPDALWQHSLTKKGQHYFHHVLQILSAAPVFSLAQGYSMEEDWCIPRIRFTEQDLTEYFWNQISSTERSIWILGHNMHKEILYLLTRLSTSFSDVEPLDYLMYLLDEMIRDENKQHIKGLISVTDYIGNTLETYRNTILEAKAKGYHQPRWPSCF